MKRGPKPAPTAVKIAKGEKKNRINFQEPKFKKERDGAPPAMLDAMAAEEWNRLFPELKKTGTLCQTDRQTFAAYCHAYSMWRGAVETMSAYPALVIKGEDAEGKPTKPVILPHCFQNKSGDIRRIPAVDIAEKWSRTMVRIAAEMGLTPSSRSGVNGSDPEKAKDDDMMTFLLGGQKNAA